MGYSLDQTHRSYELATHLSQCSTGRHDGLRFAPPHSYIDMAAAAAPEANALAELQQASKEVVGDELTGIGGDAAKTLHRRPLALGEAAKSVDKLGETRC